MWSGLLSSKLNDTMSWITVGGSLFEVGFAEPNGLSVAWREMVGICGRNFLMLGDVVVVVVCV